ACATSWNPRLSTRRSGSWRRPRGARGVKSEMSQSAGTNVKAGASDPALSLYHLLEPEVLANPYPLYHRLRNEDPVHWDPFLHEWVVTRYADVIRVLHEF